MQKVRPRIEGFIEQCEARLFGGLALAGLPAEGARAGAPPPRVLVDGTPWPGPLGESARLEAGEHELEVHATGYAPFHLIVYVAAGVTTTHQVALRPLPDPAVASSQSDLSARRGAEGAGASWKPVLGWTSTGLGVAALGAGGFFLWRMGDLDDQANKAYARYEQDPNDQTYGPVDDKLSASRTSGYAGYALLGTGLALGGLGAWALLMSSVGGTGTGSTAFVAPVMDGSSMGLSIGGRW